MITEKKDILILGKGPTQGIEYTLSAENVYPINFKECNKKFCFRLHYNGANSYLFVNGTETYRFKAKGNSISRDEAVNRLNNFVLEDKCAL